MSITGEPVPGATPVVEETNPKIQVPVGIAAHPASVVEAKLSMEEVKKELVNPRTISKKIDPEGRTETTKVVSEARVEAQTIQEGITNREQRIQQIAELTSVSYQREWEKAQELTQRLRSIVAKLMSLVGINVQTEIKALKEERKALDDMSFDLKRELANLKLQQTETPTPKQLLEAYYEKVSTQPLTNEQKRNLLKTEVLASLTEEEYITLWKRLNPYFLSHVTRQGFRDHTGGDVMVNHASGYHEYVGGFVDVMKNGRCLFPPLARVGLVNRDEATVKSFLLPFLQIAASRDEAREMFRNFLNRGLASAPKYPDITATHLAAQIVSDRYYGGENGNEVFFTYPSDVLASQYAFAFNGWGKDFTKPQNEIKWNDIFVWTDPNNPGIPVDSGIVFLPERIPVDPETGSKYASEVRIIDGKEKRVMIENTGLVNSFVEWGVRNQSLLRQALITFRITCENEKNDFMRRVIFRDSFTPFTKGLQELGLDPNTSTALVDQLITMIDYKRHFDINSLQEAIKGSRAHLKRAENAIPAKDYWEKFFAKNPHLRPKHVQYYDGDPTTAVFDFQRKNNIGQADTLKTDGQLLGFDDHHVTNMGNDSRSNAGNDELVEMANKIIAEHYSKVTV